MLQTQNALADFISYIEDIERADRKTGVRAKELLQIVMRGDRMFSDTMRNVLKVRYMEEWELARRNVLKEALSHDVIVLYKKRAMYWQSLLDLVSSSPDNLVITPKDMQMNALANIPVSVLSPALIEYLLRIIENIPAVIDDSRKENILPMLHHWSASLRQRVSFREQTADSHEYVSAMEQLTQWIQCIQSMYEQLVMMQKIALYDEFESVVDWVRMIPDQERMLICEYFLTCLIHSNDPAHTGVK